MVLLASTVFMAPRKAPREIVSPSPGAFHAESALFGRSEAAGFRFQISKQRPKMQLYLAFEPVPGLSGGCFLTLVPRGITFG